MPQFTSETRVIDRLVVSGEGLHSRQVTILSGQVLAKGAVLGKVTASGKYIKSLSAAVDGSQNPAAILPEAVDASGGDAAVPAYMGGYFDENELDIGTGHTAASIFDALRGLGIKLVNSVSA